MAETVSVVSIVRNGADYLAEALRSVLASTHPVHEILVVDGGSTDSTREIALEMGAQVLLQQSEGIAGAYNEGIGAATGEWIAFISHDDLWHPGKLARQMALLRDRPGTEICVCNVEHVLAASSVPTGFRTELLETPVAGYIMEALVASRGAFDRVGLFDSRYAVSNDTDWFARVRHLGLEIAVVPETLVTKRVHGENSTLQPRGFNRQLLDVVRASVARKKAAPRTEPAS